ncbi:DinB family protein [Ferruginibacter yonginensis]|uniref:DinB family protein n=1 Tax=Ferruginibacter yonginensis TaxID=1310416 RepID=A0ABV8QXW9_9BACT
MKKLFVQYAAYNLWANQRITEAINNLTDDQINTPAKSSFADIHKTVLHLWAVENVWWQRLKLIEREVWVGEDFEGSIMELTNNLLQQSKQWKEWVDVATEAALQHEFIYKNSKKDQFKQPVYEMLVHLFNHQTYHRGQLVTLMRQTGETIIPNTDLIAFLRKK